MSHITPAIQDIVNFNTIVVFVSLSIRRAMQLICTVYEKGLLWPDYAWIFHSYTIEDFLCQQPICDMKSALNGMIIIDGQLKSEPPDPHRRLVSGITFISYYEQYLLKLSEMALEYNITLNPNEYAKLLYDLVWETAIALNNSCPQITSCEHQPNFTTTQQFYQQYQWEVTISYIRNLRSILIGTVYHNYNSSVMKISYIKAMFDSAPVDELPVLIVAPPFGYTIGVALQIALTGLFITLMLVLYIFFHKEPEIRATSFTLSLLMFAGCYLNLLFLILFLNHTINSINTKNNNYLCIFLLWLSAYGISLPLMLAVLLVKMLRVYHIFSNEKVRLGRYCSDLSLAGYVLLILSPDILLHLIWFIVDHYQINVEHKIENGVIHIDKRCVSKYTTVWIGLLIVYLLMLIFALAIVAVKSRKVRLQNFKDTKKVNILLFILSLDIFTSFSYWLLLQTLNSKRYITNLPVHIGHSVLIVSFLSLLMVPKISPPFWRCVKQISFNFLRKK